MNQVAQRAGRRLAIVAGAVVVSFARLAHAAPTWHEEANPSVVAPETGDLLGSCAALSGDTAVVGAARRKNGAGVKTGAAYVLSRKSGQWALSQTLAPSDLPSGGELGWSCAVSGDRLVVGASMSGSGLGGVSGPGAAYVYAFDGATWMLEQKLVAGDPESGSWFGSTVAIDQTTIVVGSFAKASFQGAAYVFSRGPTGWSAPQKIVGADSTSGDRFGSSVAVSGTTMLVGAPGRTGGRGAGYVFTKSGASWTEAQALTASGAAASDFLGSAVAVTSPAAASGTAVLGGSGKAYVFSRAIGAWTEQQQLVRPSPGNDAFGVPVTLSGDSIFVGAPLRNSREGSVFVFAKTGTTWTALPELRASNPSSSAQFGSALSASGPRLLVGSPASALLPGQAYVFRYILGKGDACNLPSECLDGFCVDGVCCDTACGGSDPNDCQVCTKAKGAISDGTCGPAATRFVCRPPKSECDVVEHCDGVSMSCPADAVVTNGAACSTGTCIAGDCAVDGVSADGGVGSSSPETPESRSSCGCRLAGRPSPGIALLVLVVVAASAGVARRRRLL